MPYRRLRPALCALAIAVWTPVAIAGEGNFEPDDVHEHGVPFFGEVKDVRSFAPVENVLVRIQLQGTLRFVLVQTDSDGRFRRPGLGPDVDPDKVEVTCQKQGFRTVDVLRRRPSRAKDAPVEVECLLEKI